MSGDIYMISRANHAGAFANMPKTKAKVIAEANAFAAARGKIAVPVDTRETFPTHEFPSFEYQFRLEDPPSPAQNPNDR